MDNINACAPREGWLAYIIGTRAHRISIHTQQLRVLKLISDLDRESAAFRKAEHIAVIGGGFAGITAAAALQSLGKTVQLYERKRRLLPLQYYSRTRYIHPTAINWPHVPLYPVSDLPFLNWHCGFADEVSRTVHNSFVDQFLISKNSSINLNLSCEVTSVLYNEKAKYRPVHVKFERVNRESGATESDDGKFCAVFFACGFDVEPVFTPYFSTSYWEDSTIRPIKSSLHPPSIGIVGDGDRALIELIRCFWRNRSLDEIYRGIADQTALSSKEDIKALDNKILKGELKGVKASSEQNAIFSAAVKSGNARDFLRRKIEFDTVATIYSSGKFPYSEGAAPLHKIMLSYLLGETGLRVTHQQGWVHEVRHDPATGMYDVKVGPKAASEIHGLRVFEHDRIVARTGPSKDYPDIIKRCFKPGVLKKYTKIAEENHEFLNPRLDYTGEMKSFYFSRNKSLETWHSTEAGRLLESYLEKSRGLFGAKVSVTRAKNGNTAILKVKISATNPLLSGRIERSVDIISWMGYAVDWQPLSFSKGFAR